MNGAEAKDALTKGGEVYHNGIEYDRISAIIYRIIGGKLSISAEMIDKNQNCVVIAPIEKISREVQSDD